MCMYARACHMYQDACHHTGGVQRGHAPLHHTRVRSCIYVHMSLQTNKSVPPYTTNIQYSGALPPYCHTTETTVQRGPAPLLPYNSNNSTAGPCPLTDPTIHNATCSTYSLKQMPPACLYLLMPLLLQPLQTAQYNHRYDLLQMSA